MPNNPLKMKGGPDAETGGVALRTDRRFTLAGGGPNTRFTITASLQRGGYLLGTVDYPGCGRVIAYPSTVRNAQYAAVRLLNQMRGEDMKADAEREYRESRTARKRAGWVPVELSPNGGPAEARGGGNPVYSFEYFDVTMDPNYEEDFAIRPIDEVHHAFRARDERCLSTTRVSWRGSEGTASAKLFGRKSYVVECDGGCEDLLYSIYIHQWSALRGRPIHAGRAGKYPTIRLEVPFMVETQVRWTFTVPPDRSRPPRVRIHTWSPGSMDYGGGCNFDWS